MALCHFRVYLFTQGAILTLNNIKTIMFGFEKQNPKSDQEAVQKELERAQAEKLRVIAEPDSPQKEGMLRALNDIIANLQEQIGTGLETATEPAIVESPEDVNITGATKHINELITKETISEEEKEATGEHIKTLLVAQSIAPTSERIQTALVLLNQIQAKPVERRDGGRN